MKNKNSGFNASGPARLEFMRGDICRDEYSHMTIISRGGK